MFIRLVPFIIIGGYFVVAGIIALIFAFINKRNTLMKGKIDADGRHDLFGAFIWPQYILIPTIKTLDLFFEWCVKQTLPKKQRQKNKKEQKEAFLDSSSYRRPPQCSNCGAEFKEIND